MIASCVVEGGRDAVDPVVVNGGGDHVVDIVCDESILSSRGRVVNEGMVWRLLEGFLDILSKILDDSISRLLTMRLR